MASTSSLGRGRARADRGSSGGRGGAPTSSGVAQRGRLGVVDEVLSRPLASYYLVLVSTALLVSLGALMVLSSSSVYAQSQAVTGHDPYYYTKKQMVFLALGVPLAWVVSRLKQDTLKLLSWVAMAGAIIMLLAVFVPGLGTDAGKGNLAWLKLGPLTVQPSEFAKLALVMWSAALVSTKERVLDRPKEVLPLLLGYLVVVGLVLAENDLGTSMVLIAILFGVLWIIGIPWTILALMVGLGGATVGIMVAISPNRMTRILSFLGLAADDPNASQQPISAIYALATGGWWGVGLGEGRQKWGNLYDAAMNDYVFAVLGEEMGLVGTVMVIVLFGVLGCTGLRIALRSDSTYNRVLCGGATVWLMFQSMVNIGVAMKMLPVLGVPLPFVSYGGSALLASLLAVGLLLSCARQEPAARRALARRRGEPAPRVTTVVDGGR